MSRLDDAVRKYRRLLYGLEDDAVRQIVEKYLLVENSIARRLIRLLEELDDAGARSPISWLFERDRLVQLLAQTNTELATWAGFTESFIAAGQADAVAMAAAAAPLYVDARSRTPEILSSWNRIPFEALEQFVGSLGDRSPLRSVFSRYGVIGAQALEDGITTALALGISPREAGRQIRRAMTGDDAFPPGFDQTFQGLQKLQYQATLTARTEINRSHRGAALENYRANDDVVIGYESLSARDARTCIICWAADGQVFPLDKTVTSWHPQCRCTWIPVLRDMEPSTTGIQAFEQLSQADKIEILGDGKYDLYRSGLSIDQFSYEFEDERWGVQRRELSLERLTRN